MAGGPFGRVLLVAVLVAAAVPLSASPAIAYDEDWGFSYLLVNAGPPGTELDAGLKRQISHDVPYAGDEVEPLPIRIGDEMCDDAGLALLDSDGRVVAAETVVMTSTPFGDVPTVEHARVPDDAGPGTYFLREFCVYGTGEPDPSGLGRDWSDPIYQLPEGLHPEADCVEFEVTAPGTYIGLPYRVYRGGGPLLSDPCPESVFGVLDSGLGGVGTGLYELMERSAGLIAPVVLPPTTTTTTTTRAQNTSAPAPPAPPAPDQVPPQVTGLVVNGGVCANKGVFVQATASDNVGVTSITFAWSASGGASGSGTLSGGPSTFSGSFTVPPGSFGQTITVVATAHDGAGNSNPSSPSSDDCG